MIDRTALTEFIESRLDGSDYFLVEVRVTPSNEITVEIDSMDNVDIDFCVGLTREIEEAFPRDEEDYELEVGSAGLTSPFKVKKQYEKNIGNEVEVLGGDGRKYKGVLTSAGDTEFSVVSLEKVRKEGSKRPVEEEVERVFPYNEVKYTKYLLQF